MAQSARKPAVHKNRHQEQKHRTTEISKEMQQKCPITPHDGYSPLVKGNHSRLGFGVVHQRDVWRPTCCYEVVGTEGGGW